MTDREMLTMAYGALKTSNSSSNEIIKRIEAHLFAPPPMIVPLHLCTCDTAGKLKIDGVCMKCGGRL